MKKLKSRVEAIGMLRSTEGEATHYLQNGDKRLFFREMSMLEQIKFDGSFLIEFFVKTFHFFFKKNGKT